MRDRSEHLHMLTERLAALFRSSLRQTASSHGLKLVQLEALIYFSTANRYSDTPAALTEYLGITKGTVSQTLKALARRGLVEKRPDDVDRRLQHCSVTDQGRLVVREAFPAFSLPTTDERPGTEDVIVSLQALLSALQKLNGFKTFGVCRSCTHFEPRSRGGRCGLTKEALTVSDSHKICREHAPAAVST